MNFTLTLLTHRRPHYLKHTIANILELDGLNTWEQMAVMDRPDGETYERVTSHFPYMISRLPVPEGENDYDVAYKQISFMTYLTIDTAFAKGADFVFHLEEDVVPATELLKFVEFNAEFYKDAKDVFTINAWVSPKQDGELSSELFQWFTPWGWGTWKDRWFEMRAGWSFNRWDQELNERMRGDRYGVFPTTSLTKNIGAVGTQPIEEYIEREKQ
jgi:hypothetical protein